MRIWKGSLWILDLRHFGGGHESTTALVTCCRVICLGDWIYRTETFLLERFIKGLSVPADNMNVATEENRIALCRGKNTPSTYFIKRKKIAENRDWVRKLQARLFFVFYSFLISAPNNPTDERRREERNKNNDVHGYATLAPREYQKITKEWTFIAIIIVFFLFTLSAWRREMKNNEGMLYLGTFLAKRFGYIATCLGHNLWKVGPSNLNSKVKNSTSSQGTTSVSDLNASRK